MDCWRENTCIDFTHFGLESGMVFEETNSKRLIKKEREIREFEMDFKNFFGLTF